MRFAQTYILGRLRHQTFFSLTECNEAIGLVMQRMNGRPMRKLGVSRRELFETIERSALNKLPDEDWEFAEWRRARVNLDYHIEVHDFLYSVPHALIRAEVDGLLLEYELTLRRQKQFETRARAARLRHAAAVEDVDYQNPRGLDRALFLKLAACDWIAERRNLLITGASGLGKSWLACALGHKACRENMSVLYTRMPRLFADLAIAHGDARYGRLLRSIARVKLLILDDWGPESLTPDQARDLLEIVEDRYDKGSLVITSQVPVDRWHDMIGVPTLADAILDQIVHNAYRVELAGESLRKRQTSPKSKHS